MSTDTEKLINDLRKRWHPDQFTRAADRLEKLEKRVAELEADARNIAEQLERIGEEVK